MDLPHNTLVAVADGRKLLLFKNEGDAQHVNLQTVHHEDRPSAATSEQGSDSPGTSHSSVGPGRSGYEQTDFHQQDEDDFAKHTAELLKRLALEGWVDKLVVVAPPKALGVMRKHYHKEVEAKLLAEINKDLTMLPVGEIEKALAAA